jgi:hypothetical protein
MIKLQEAMHVEETGLREMYGLRQEIEASHDTYMVAGEVHTLLRGPLGRCTHC